MYFLSKVWRRDRAATAVKIWKRGTAVRMLFSPDFIDSICETFIDYSYSVNLFSRKFHYKLI